MSDKFKRIYEESIKNPEKFWQEASNDIFWFKKPTKILNKSNPPFYKWFEDGVTNTCYNALDIHIDNGDGKRTALIYDSPITGNKSKFTYEELRSKVAKFAGALKSQGATKGLYSTVLPGSKPHEAVTNTFALLSSILLASSLEANPPKTTE